MSELPDEPLEPEPMAPAPLDPGAEVLEPPVVPVPCEPPASELLFMRELSLAPLDPEPVPMEPEVLSLAELPVDAVPLAVFLACLALLFFLAWALCLVLVPEEVSAAVLSDMPAPVDDVPADSLFC